MSLAMDILNIQSNERLSLCNTSWRKKNANELRLDNSNRLWKTIRSTVLKLALSNLKFRTVAISTWKLFHLWRWAFFITTGFSKEVFRWVLFRILFLFVFCCRCWCINGRAILDWCNWKPFQPGWGGWKWLVAPAVIFARFFNCRGVVAVVGDSGNDFSQESSRFEAKMVE